MRAHLAERIFSDLVRALDEMAPGEGIAMLSNPSSARFVSDIAGLDSRSDEARTIRLAIASGAFEGFKSFADYDRVRKLIKAFSAQTIRDDDATVVLAAFCKVAGIPAVGTAEKRGTAPKEQGTSAFSPSPFGSISDAVPSVKRYGKSETDGVADSLYAKARKAYFEDSWSDEDFSAAISLYNEAVRHDSARAMLDLVWLDRIGVVRLSKAQADLLCQRALSRLIKEATEQKSSRVMVMAGDMLRSERFGKFSEAFRWYESAAEAGDGQAMCRIGEMYERGEGTQRNAQQAVLWYERAASVLDGEGLWRLSLCLEKGAGCAKDFERARALLEKSSEMGFLKASFRLGRLLFLLYPDRRDEAEGLCRKAALYGDAQASFWCWKHNVRGKERDKWLLKSSYLGNPSAVFECARGIGLREGPEHFSSNSKAIALFERAANLGSASAAALLSRIYREGRFVRRDFSKSFVFLEVAANLGDRAAMNRVSQMLYSGVGAKKDSKAAQEWFELAEKRSMEEGSLPDEDSLEYPGCDREV